MHTRLLSPDNRVIVLPNSKVAGDAIVNHSACGTRRIDLVVGIGYGDDLARAIELCAIACRRPARAVRARRGRRGVATRRDLGAARGAAVGEYHGRLGRADLGAARDQGAFRRRRHPHLACAARGHGAAGRRAAGMNDKGAATASSVRSIAGRRSRRVRRRHSVGRGACSGRRDGSGASGDAPVQWVQSLRRAVAATSCNPKSRPVVKMRSGSLSNAPMSTWLPTQRGNPVPRWS